MRNYQQTLVEIRDAVSTLAPSAPVIVEAPAAPVVSEALPIAGKDLNCRYFDFPEQSSAFLVLPAVSDDPVVAAYLERRELNSYMLDVLSETTKAGDQVIDLGCHVGTFSIGASAMGRKVLSVDASLFHLSLVAHSKDINRFPQLRLSYAAISQHEGTVRFVENGLFGSIDFAGDSSSAVETPAKGLDRLVDEHGISSVRFLKMDIEGAEFDAIVTGQTLLHRDRPVIWYESNGPTLVQAGHSVDELRVLLERHGYRTFRVEGDRWIYAPPGQIQPEMWVDMLALSERDQKRFAHRISTEWHPADVLNKCVEWANTPHLSTRRYLLSEINAHRFDATMSDEILEIGATLGKEFPAEARDESPASV
jgi:FkbM family methyltransferase